MLVTTVTKAPYGHSGRRAQLNSVRTTGRGISERCRNRIKPTVASRRTSVAFTNRHGRYSEAVSHPRDGCNQFQQLETQGGNEASAQAHHTVQRQSDETVTISTSTSHIKRNNLRNYNGSVSCMSGSVPQSPPRL